MTPVEKQYATLSIYIRSFIFFIASTIGIIFFSLAVVSTLPFSIKRRFKVIRAVMGSEIFLAKLICGIEYKVEGMENITEMPNAIVFSKHQSTWETFFLPTIIPLAAFIAKEELLWVPFFGWAFATSKPITIDRSNKSTAMQQIINTGKRCLEEGRWVVVFPEGTRVAAGTVGHYKLGGARLATATGYPIVPIAHNAGRFWPRRKFLKYPGTVRMVIGPRIDIKGCTPEEALERAKNWIESTMLRIDSDNLPFL